MTKYRLLICWMQDLDGADLPCSQQGMIDDHSQDNKASVNEFEYEFPEGTNEDIVALALYGLAFQADWTPTDSLSVIQKLDQGDWINL